MNHGINNYVKDFESWYRIRHNVTNEGIFSNLASGAASLTGLKQKYQNWKNDPRSMYNRPHSPEQSALDPNVKKLTDQFANNIGLSKFISNHPLYTSMRNMVVARVYGHNAIELGDLEHVWNQLQKTDKSGRTLGQKYGISRPYAIISKIPGARSNQKYQITDMAADFDEQEAKRQADRATKAAHAQPQGNTNTVPNRPSKPPGKLPKPIKDAVITMQARYEQLKIKTTRTRAEDSEMKSIANWYSKIVGKTIS